MTASAKTLRALEAKLQRDIAIIYTAIERAEPSRLLQQWRRNPDEDVLNAMRRAIRRIDGTMEITTDALIASFAAGLYSMTRHAAATKAERGAKRKGRR